MPKFKDYAKAFGKSLKNEMMDEFGISGAKKIPVRSVLTHDMFGHVYLKGFKTPDQLTPEESDRLSAELISRIGVDDFELYKALWSKYVKSIQGRWGTSSLPTVGGFERWLATRLQEQSKAGV